jgi:hypothetical protein
MASIVRLTQNSVCDKKDEHQHSKQTHNRSGDRGGVWSQRLHDNLKWSLTTFKFG